MKFLSIPENGSSWVESLIYEIDMESSTPQDLTVEIVNSVTHQSLGICRLYGVQKARVDIAPYVRAACVNSLENNTISSLVISKAACKLFVVANGNISDERLYFRAKIDSSRAQLLSTMPERQSIVLGDVVRFTVLALSKVEVRLVVKTALTNKQTTLSCQTLGMPVEAIIPTATLPAHSSRITIHIYCDGELINSLVCDVARRDSTARTLVWINGLGGVEYYTFPHSKRTSYEAKVESISYGQQSDARVLRATIYRSLLSGAELSEEMERIAALLFSPKIYECRGGELIDAELPTRVLKFDKHNRLPQIVVDIAERWQGGELC